MVQSGTSEDGCFKRKSLGQWSLQWYMWSRYLGPFWPFFLATAEDIGDPHVGVRYYTIGETLITIFLWQTYREHPVCKLYIKIKCLVNNKSYKTYWKYCKNIYFHKVTFVWLIEDMGDIIMFLYINKSDYIKRLNMHTLWKKVPGCKSIKGKYINLFRADYRQYHSMGLTCYQIKKLWHQ